MSYIGDFAEDYATLNLKFTTRTTAGVPTAFDVTSPIAAVSVYKANGAVQSVAGITLTPSFDGVAGLNNVLIDLSADVFYAIGNDYQVVITTGTVNSVSVVGEVIAEFSIENRFDEVDVTKWLGTAAATPSVAGVPEVDVTHISSDSTAADNLESQYDTTGLTGGTFPANQDQLGGIANVGSAVHRPAASYTLTTGTQSANTVAATEALDQSRHEHTDTAGAMDLYYEFNIGAGIPSSAQVTGYVTGNNDDVDIYGYDWVAAGWVQIGNLQGGAIATDQVNSYDMFIDMVGTGANAGVVRVRFYKAAGLTTALLAVDQIFVAFSQGNEGYEGGAVWFDSNASNTGTTKTDGTSTNPVSTEAAVNTLLANNNLNRVTVAPGSTITFTTGHTGEIWGGSLWSLALGGQDIASSLFIGASVSGIGTGASEFNFNHCNLGACTLHPFHAEGCGLSGTITAGAAGDFVLSNCHSRIAGATTPIFDTGAAIGNVNLAMPGYFNGIEIQNLNATGADSFSIAGTGQIIYAASSSGTSNQRGDWKATNTGGLTLTKDDNSTKADSLTFSVANQVDSNVKAVSDDSTAADNLELQYDTTGLTGDNFPATQAQVGAIVTTGAAINVAAESYVLTAGTQSANTFAATAPLDGVRHEHTDATGAMDLYYQFDVTSDGVPTTITAAGYLVGGNDSLGVYAYNWAGSSWDQVGTLVGSGSTTNVAETYALYTSHVGTGANLGKVRIRYYAASGLTTATLALDQVYVSYATVPVISQTKGAVSDATPTATGFNTDLTEADGIWDDAILEFTSGLNAGCSRTITTHVNASGAVTFDEAFPETVADTDTFVVKHTHVHPVSQIVAGVLTTQMTESYAANGVAPTLAQAQFAIHQMLQQFGISGTSITVRQLDDLTTAFVVTLDDGTNPTDAKRV